MGAWSGSGGQQLAYPKKTSVSIMLAMDLYIQSFDMAWTCTLCSLIASVNLTALDRITSRPRMECEGDIIPYKCVIISNSESLHLIWYVTLPDLRRLDVRFDNTSSLDTVRSLGNNITAVLTSFNGSGGRIESTIYLVIQRGLVATGTGLLCGIQIYDNVIAMDADYLAVEGA